MTFYVPAAHGRAPIHDAVGNKPKPPRQHPRISSSCRASASSEAILLDFLEAPEAFSHTAAPRSATTSTVPAEGTASPAANFLIAHQHVNRMLAHAAAGVGQALSSRSFRSGGAQHANARANLADS